MNIQNLFNNTIKKVKKYFSKRNREFRRHWRNRIVVPPGMTIEEYFFNYNRNRSLSMALKRKGIQRIDTPFSPWNIVK